MTVSWCYQYSTGYDMNGKGKHGVEIRVVVVLAGQERGIQ